MKLFRYYNQEILHLMLMIMISFLVIMTSVSFVRYLAMAADGAMPLKNAVAILGVILPNFINVLLPISLFLAVVLGLNRLLHDNELLIGFAGGMSFVTLIKKLFRFAVPISLIGFILSFAIVPKMNDYQNQLIEINSQNSSILNFIQSGRFFAFGANQIIYVSNVDLKTRQSHDIFLYQNTQESTQVILAPSGSITTDGNTLATVSLNNGQEYELTNTPGSLAVRMANFEKLLMTLIPTYDFNNSDLTAVNTIALWGQHTIPAQVELEWRAALPIATLILTLLGAVLNDLRPRTSKLIKIFYALAIFIIYFNLMSVVKSMLLHEYLPILPGLFIVPLGFLGVGLILLAYRENWFHRIKR